MAEKNQYQKAHNYQKIESKNPTTTIKQPKTTKKQPSKLTNNQTKFIALYSQGLTQKQITEELHISQQAVSKMFLKLHKKGYFQGVDSKTQNLPPKNNSKIGKNTDNSLGGGQDNLPCPLPPLISLGTTKKKVLQLLSEGGNPHSIARKTELRRATIQQHLHELQANNFVKKDNYLWHITKRGSAYLGGRLSLVGYERGGQVVNPNKQPHNWLQDRAHNIKIKVPVMKKPDNDFWLLDWNANKKIKNNVFYNKSFGDILITYTGKSFIFQLPVLRFKDSEIAVAEAGRITTELIKKHEADIPGLKLSEYPNIKAQLIAQHHAVPNDPYAKFCLKHGITYRDDLIDIDASENSTPEIEFTDSEQSHIHHQRYIEHQRDILLNNPPTNTELFSLMAEETRINKETAAGLGVMVKTLGLITQPSSQQPEHKKNKKQEAPWYVG